MPDDTSDSIYRALAAEPRRRISRALNDVDAQITVTELSELIERDDRVLSERGREDDGHAGTTAIALHHVHLPLLDDAAILEYDATRREVRPGSELSTAIEAIGALDPDGGE